MTTTTFDTQTRFLVGQCKYAACELTAAGFPPTQAGAVAYDRQQRRGDAGVRKRVAPVLGSGRGLKLAVNEARSALAKAGIECDCSRWTLDNDNRCVNCGKQHN